VNKPSNLARCVSTRRPRTEKLFLFRQIYIGETNKGSCVIVIFLHYFHLTNFFWMFVEGKVLLSYRSAGLVRRDDPRAGPAAAFPRSAPPLLIFTEINF
jgi:7 transmembrane receptor (Secretin family)